MSESQRFEIGDADQWVTALHRVDEPVEKMSVADIQLVARVSVSGHRSPEEGLRVLADPALRELLLRTWRDEPPGADLRDDLERDVVGRDLLALVSPPESRPGSGLWSRITSAAASRLAFSDLTPITVGGASRSPSDPGPSRAEQGETVTMRSRIAGGGSVTFRRIEPGRWVVTVFKEVEAGEVVVVSWSDDEHHLVRVEAGDHAGGLELDELVAPSIDAVPAQVYLGPLPADLSAD